MNRRRYLVSYDIADDKRRTRVFKTLRDEGDHAQYSVFFCELTPAELARLRANLDEAIHHDEDQVLILDLGLGEHPLDAAMECLGRPYAPTSRVFVV